MLHVLKYHNYELFTGGSYSEFLRCQTDFSLLALLKKTEKSVRLRTYTHYKKHVAILSIIVSVTLK